MSADIKNNITFLYEFIEKRLLFPFVTA